MKDIAAQGALCFVVPVAADRRGRVDDLVRTMGPRIAAAFRRTTTLHFARFAVLPPPLGMDGKEHGDASLVFEAHYDEPDGEHYADLAHAAQDVLEEIYAETLDPPPKGSLDGAGLEAYVKRHYVATAARFLSHPGLPAARIAKDAALRKRIDAWLDAKDPRTFPNEAVLVAALREELADDVAEAAAIPEGRGMRPAWVGSAIFNGCLYVPVAVLGTLLRGLVRPLELLVDPKGDPRSPEPLREGSPRMARLMAQEDWPGMVQNALTHVVPLKAGAIRRFVIDTVFRVVGIYVDLVARYEGRLGGVTSIHFARWLHLPDGRLLFMSNYDGSWESYLGDFVDKVSVWLNAVWANSCGYPPTEWLIGGGAELEEPFKRWARACQVPNAFFFCAYPDLGVRNVLDNATLRELLGKPLTEERAKTIARLL